MNMEQELFEAIQKESDYYFVELPKEVSDRVRYHIWLILTLLGGIWIFLQAVIDLKLEDWLPPSEASIFFLSLATVLVLISLAFAMASVFMRKHLSPDYRAILREYEKEKGDNKEPTIDSEFGQYWVERLLRATDENLKSHEKSMKLMKVAQWLLIGMLISASFIPIWMLLKLFCEVSNG